MFIDSLTEQSIVDLVLYFNHSYHNRIFLCVRILFLLCGLICDAQYRLETSVISPVMLTVLHIGVRVVWEYSRCQHVYPKFSSLWFFLTWKWGNWMCYFFSSVMIEFKNPPPPGNINFIKLWTLKKFNDVHINWQGPTHLLVC